MKKLIIILFLSIANIAFAETIYCKVIAITGGDTTRCLTDHKEQLKIRLYQIDAPETKQAFDKKSKRALSDLILNENVLIYTHGQNKYKHTLATIYLIVAGFCTGKGENVVCATSIDYEDINLKMIDKGMAWYYPFARNNDQYKQAEEQARKNKVGLWADKNPVAPWEFRKKK